MKRLQTLVRTVVFAVIIATTGPIFSGAVSPFSVQTAQAAVARSIIVKGNSRIEAETVRSYMTIQNGRRYSASDVDESLKALFATGLFEDVRISPQGGSLVVTVRENPMIGRVAFEGNRKINDDMLKTVVRSDTRAMLSRANVQSDVQNILEVYRRSGRYDASVEPKIIDRGGNRVDLVFEINEGDKTGVERITFIGNHAFSDGRLRDVIRTRESGFLSWLRSTDTYDPDRLALDQELLRQYYFKKGYADFRILSASAELDREQNVFHVTFTVEEGEEYTISDVEVVSSVDEIDANSLRSQVRTDPGDTFNSVRVEQSVEDLTTKVSDQGYAFAQVNPRASRDYENRTISLTYYVEEGARAYVERINIIGNDRTREYVIRREFDLAEGDAFNRALIQKAERRLNNLGFFKRVSINTAQGSAPDRVVINVQVEEKSTGSLDFGVGYSTNEGVVGDVSVTEKNFLGRGQYLRLAVGGSKTKRSYEFAFIEPFFLGRRIAFDVDLYKKSLKHSKNRHYDEEKIGGGFGFSLPLREEELTLRLYYQIYRTRITDAKKLATGIKNCSANKDLSIALCDSLGSHLTSAVGYTLTYDTLDSALRPTDGFYAQFGQEFAGVGGNAYYLKTTAQARAYKELVADYGIIGMVGLRAGHVTALGNKRLRISEQFSMGGDMVRGFADDGIGPRDFKTNTAIGGQMFIAGTVETTFPFFGLPEEFGLRGALFADAGALWNADKRLVNLVGSNQVINNKFAFRASVGAGVRWDSPFGPLQVDFAWPVLKQKGDRTQMFRLSGGTRF